MLSKSFIASIFLLASVSSVNAHAGINPALGVKGQITRNQVQRPSANSPCGNVNIAQTLDSSATVQADANGNFSPSIQNFNGGTDGSRSIKTVQVDSSGTGKNFVPAKMVVNGNGDPTSDAAETLTAQLPPGTKCTGGANKDLCLASFTTTAGFGNCVVVSQGSGTPNTPAPRSASGQTNLPRNGAAKGVVRSTEPRAADDAQASQKAQSGKAGKAKDEKKKKDNGKKKDDKNAKKGKGDKNAKNGKVDKGVNNGQVDSSVNNGQGGKSVNNGQGGKSVNNGQVDKNAKNGKDGKKGDKKKGEKKNKGDKKNAKQANKGAKGKPAATDNNNRKRSWSSRQMGNFA